MDIQPEMPARAMSSHAKPLKADSPQEAHVYDDGHLRVEHKNYYVACDGTQIRLSRKEFLIFSYLAQHAGRVIPAEEIWSYTWGETAGFNANTLKVHIHRIRRQLEPFEVQIKNSPNNGYRLISGPRTGQRGKGEQQRFF